MFHLIDNKAKIAFPNSSEDDQGITQLKMWIDKLREA